jgi:protein involved in polysaccharide export with SLBB domain
MHEDRVSYFEGLHLLKSFFRLTIVLTALVHLAGTEALAQARPTVGLLMSREELTAAAERAEIAASGGDASARSRNASLALSLRQRLRDGDFQAGDRVVVEFMSDVFHRDTLVVRGARMLELPGKIMVPLTGVLRSEVEDRVTTELMKYVRAQQIDVTPLMRVGVLGDVAHPGYFAFASDIPLTDAIMGAGGPTATADLEKSVVRRGSVVIRSSDETRKAIASGLTLDQFGLNAGDELFIGQRGESRTGMILGVVGALGTIATLFVALRR